MGNLPLLLLDRERLVGARQKHEKRVVHQASALCTGSHRLAEVEEAFGHGADDADGGGYWIT